MTDTDPPPSTGEEVLARLFAELEGTPRTDWASVAARYAAAHPAAASDIRGMVAAAGGVRPPSDPSVGPALLDPDDRLGDFRVVRFVAKGGMGEVYEAVQEPLGRRVALKVIRKGFAGPLARGRFEQEQAVLAKLHQTNIVPAYHAGLHGDIQYCAMQYIDGASVHRVLTTVRETPGGQGAATPPIRDVVHSIMASAATPPPDRTLSLGPVSEPVMADRRPLSARYFESVAAVMAQVADAIQHGHDQRVMHRDIKPSNLIIDAAGTCWVIDYGLAGTVAGDDPTPPADADGRLTQGPVGTPRYMAPEQFAGQPVPASDVWGLGATLYELLALRPAFDGKTWADLEVQVTTTEPADPRTFVPNIPADLVAVCRKALAKDVATRYESAAAFAADLRRWQHWEATTVRPDWRTLRPLRLWVWRNQWRAAVIGMATLMLVTIPTAWAYQKEVHRAREVKFQQEVAEADRIRTGTPFIGWSESVRHQLTKAGQLLPGADLLNHHAATLQGPDGRVVLRHRIETDRKEKIIGYSGVAFGPDGRLLAGGYQAERIDRIDMTAALLFDANLARAPDESTLVGGGPVAFPDADTPIQLVLPTGDRTGLTLWHVGRNQKLTDIPIPAEPKRVEDMYAALSADGRFAAAAVESPPDAADNRTGWVRLWAVEPKMPGPAKPLGGWDRPATALAFSADGKYLAAGTRDGTVTIQTVADGKDLFSINNGRLPILSVAFGRNYRRDATGRNRVVPGGLPGLQLAVGTDAGTAAVWDLETKDRVNSFRGASNYINALAFTPDGTAVVTAGHNAPFVWDVATGRLAFVLTPEESNRGVPGTHQTAVAVSPDGRRVAHAYTNALGGSAGVTVVEFDNARGVGTFRGLDGQIEKARVSPSGKWVLASSQNWQVGAWERETGRLAFVWDVPKGWTPDNADLLFDEKEETVYFASSRGVTRMHLTTGERVDSWTLPLGQNEQLALRPGGNPILVRRDLDGPLERGKPRPGSKIVSRELLAGGQSRLRFPPVAAPRGTLVFVFASAHGRYLTVRTASPEASLWYDGDTGQQLALPSVRPAQVHSAAWVTDNGRFLMNDGADADGSEVHYLYTLPDKAVYRIIRGPVAGSMDDAGKLMATIKSAVGLEGMSLLRVGEDKPVVTFDFGQRVYHGERYLTGDGRFVVWGRTDGTVCVADVNQCLEKLGPFLGRGEK